MAALDLPVIWFFYFNKGNQNTTPSSSPWLVFFTPAIWERLRSRAETALKAAETGEVPDKEEGSHCQFCPYSWQCKPSSLPAPRSVHRTFNAKIRRSG
jgi:hypothetical protein